MRPASRRGQRRARKLVVLNTAHAEFAHPDFAAWRKAGVEVVLDGRNLWERYKVESFGLHYFGIGRSSVLELRLESSLAAPEHRAASSDEGASLSRAASSRRDTRVV